MATQQLDELEERTKAVVHNLYSVITQATYFQGPVSSNAMLHEINALVKNLSSLAALAPNLDPATTSVPPDVLNYVSDGRNPDIYTRQHVELAHQNNQFLKGKTDAFAQFRDVLGEEIKASVPGLEEAVDKVVKSPEARLMQGVSEERTNGQIKQEEIVWQGVNGRTQD